MISSSFYPTLASLIPLEKLPDSIVPLIENTFDDVFYKNYVSEKSMDGDSGFFALTIVLHKPLGFDFLGEEGFSLVLNPDQDGLTTEIPISVNFKLEALKYIRGFDPALVASDLVYTFELIFELLGLEESELLEEVLDSYYSDSPSPISDFVGDYNSNIDFSGSLTEPGGIISEAIADLVIQFESDPEKDIFSYVFLALTEDFDGIKRLFKKWVGNFGYKDILKLFVPEIYVSFDVIDIALIFPRNVLTPIDEFGNKIEDEMIKSRLSFNVGALSYHSKRGFEYQEESSLFLTPSFIGNTPLTLSVENLKIDIRDDQNIPEANVDGRSNAFKGVFIEFATIAFPNFFNPSAENSATIVARNLLIGSEGGVSGTIGIDTDIPDLIYLTFVPLSVELDGFVFDIDNNSMTISGLKKVINEVHDEPDVTIEEPITREIQIPIEGITVVDSENTFYNISSVGTVTIIPAPAIGLLQFTLFDTTITINDFYLTFSKSKIVSSTVTGTIEFDALDEPLNMEIDFTNGFRIHVSYPPGLDVIDNSVFTLTLNDLELGRVNEKLFVALTAKLTNNLEIPYVNKFVPNIIDAHNLRWTQGDGFDYNLSLEWANGLKLAISNDGPPALEPSKFRIPFNQNKDGGLFKLDAVDLSLTPVEDGITVGVKLAGAALNLKDVVILTVDGVGAQLTLTKVEEDGNVGPFNTVFGLIPPKGIGIDVDAKAVTGGGYVYLDFEKGRYVGVAELTIKDKITLKVIGIITTKLPSGEKGNSVLLLVTAEFSPQPLAFGFTLNGVGGLVAINRTMNLQALRDGVKNNSIDNVLFPDDPIKNIAEIISDLETIFPVQEGRYVFGLMGLIGWGEYKIPDQPVKSLITMEIGLMIEVPKPVRIAVLGVIKSILPTDDNDIVKLQVNFVGTIDFEAKYITFDASIYESNFLTFTLAGDMAFRLKWGDEPNFLFSVGGFHPSFTPPPLNLPTMDRLIINFLAEENPRLTLSTYLAITSNTLQFGALLDFYYKITDNIQVVGALGFDILIQFSPFYLRAELYAMLAVLYKKNAVLSVSLYGMLEGPKPWHVQGKAEFVFLKLNFKANFDKTFGDEGVVILPDINVMPLLTDAANNTANWQGVFPTESNLSVSLKEQADSEVAIILTHPNGSLRFEQKVVPLNMSINKFGKQTPVDYRHFSLEMIDFTTNTTKEFFAPAEFVDLSDNEKLARKSFEKMDAGISVTDSKRYKSSDYLTKKVKYEQIVYDSTEFGERITGFSELSAQNFQSWVNNNSTTNSSLGSKKTVASNFAPNKMKMASETFTIAKTEDLTAFAEIEGELTFGSEVEARIALDKLFTNNPELIDQLDVVLEHELV